MLDTIFDTLRKNNVDLWVMYNRENKDRYFCKYISKNLSTATFAFITRYKIYLVVNELDRQNVYELSSNKKYSKNIEVRIYKNSQELQECIEDVLSSVKFIPKIHLSYSTLSDQNTDILGHGEYMFVTKKIKEAYKKYQKSVKFISAEKMIYDIGSVKSRLEISRMKFIAKITEKILEATFLEIRVGMSEIDISELTRNITEETMNMYVGSNDIISFDYAWEICPIVLTGENLTKGGHCLPTVKLLKGGETIYLDFGLRVVFSDKTVLNTDMQRMGYALKENERHAPKNVMKVFNTLTTAIDEGIEKMVSGVKAYKIDEIVRKKILHFGYPDYNHATGHAVGSQVHDVGAVIATKNNKRANIPLSENSIYTLEPRIQIVNGGSIEEMIQVTKFGGIPICNTQKKLYIIK